MANISPNIKDETLAAMQHDVDRARKKQPLQAVGGMLTGSIAATIAATVAVVAKLVGEVSRHANRQQISLLEINRDTKAMEELVNKTLASCESVKALTPYAQAVMLAPFIGGALGVWTATTLGNKAITQKQALLEDAHNKNWREKVSQPSSVTERG